MHKAILYTGGNGGAPLLGMPNVSEGQHKTAVNGTDALLDSFLVNGIYLRKALPRCSRSLGNWGNLEDGTLCKLTEGMRK